MSKNTKTAPALAEGEDKAVVADGADTVKVEAPTTAAKPTVKKPDAKSAGFSVYIGPSILGVIQHGHIYDGPRAEVLKALAPIIEERPLIAPLVVDGATLSEDRIKVKTPGNLLFVNYKKLAAGEIN